MPGSTFVSKAHHKATPGRVRLSATRFHAALRQALAPFRGQVIERADAHDALARAAPELAGRMGWVLLSDHCSNHTNKGACECALTPDALVERVARGRYRVL